jgi:hypothetical protein
MKATAPEIEVIWESPEPDPEALLKALQMLFPELLGGESTFCSDAPVDKKARRNRLSK